MQIEIKKIFIGIAILSTYTVRTTATSGKKSRYIDAIGKNGANTTGIGVIVPINTKLIVTNKKPPIPSIT